MKSSRYSTLCILLLLCTASTNVLRAQKYNYTTADKSMENWSHILTDNGNGTILDINYQSSKNRNYTATTCDNDLGNMRSYELDFLNGKTYQFTYFQGGKLYIFMTDKDESLYKFQVDPHTFAMIGSLETLFSNEDIGAEYRTAYSADSAYFSILYRHHGKKATDDNFSGITFDKTFSPINRFAFSLAVPANEIMDIDFILSTTGNPSIICQGQNKGKKKNEQGDIYYSITTISGKGTPGTKTASGTLPGGIQNINWYYSNENIAFDGIVGESVQKGFTSFVSGSYNTSSGSLEKIIPTAFSGFGKNKQSGSSSMKEIIDNGIPRDVSLKSIVRFPDHSSLLIYNSEANSVSRNIDPMNPQKYSPEMSTSYGGNTYVIKLNPNTEIEWFHAILKKQVESAVDMFVGISYMVEKDNSIHIFFYDKNENTEVFTNGKTREVSMLNNKKNSLACVTIKEGGAISKTILWDNSDQESYMMPTRSVNKINEVTFVAVKKSKGGWFTLSKIKIAD